MSCNTPNTIDIQGHRGCRGLMPENTLQAFKKALELGVHTLELDLVVSKDNVVVVSHEPYMNSVICWDANGNEILKSDEKNHNLYQMIFDSIKQYDCGTKFHPRFPGQEKFKAYKPSLEEVIKASKSLNPNIKFNIEIKAEPKYDGIFTPKPREFVKLVLDVINQNNAFIETNLQSFDVRILEEIKRQESKMKVALLVDEDETIDDKLAKLSFKPEIISPYFKLLSKEIVAQYQKEHYQIIPWTVNDVDDMQQMIDFNVDGIITDYPDRLVEILK
ncbi:glycerophosphodiester phosphodiesterase [Sabulilitoribacter multivorans]|uniref:Glycerophosphodiester phosphodiesterase n=1 Tax=Flaviramulus multivorans TaxID=1304750 RepID=A0ABS9IJ39_9FLAO|nr:glycerophosphodiester phosphodiesterase family protein [Flaviramulus multivorans]MCF7560410.1 glycerophosphodiester phosphodiesterase [Flaviramulus multivorans]